MLRTQAKHGTTRRTKFLGQTNREPDVKGALSYQDVFITAAESKRNKPSLII